MHFSDIKKFNRCPRAYYYSTLMDSSSYYSFYNVDNDLVRNTVIEKLGIEDWAEGQPNQTNEDTLSLAHQHGWVFRARFEYDSVRTKIPLLYLQDNHCKIYSIILNTSVSEDEISKVNYNLHILEHLGLTVDDAFVIYLNRDYVRGAQLDSNGLWILSDQYRENRIMEFCQQLPCDLEEVSKKMAEFDYLSFEPSFSSKCSGRQRCQFFETCFPEEANVEDNSILTLVSSQYKRQMFYNGIHYLKDADMSLVEGNRVQLAQITADRNGGMYVDQQRLEQWFTDRNQYPLSFLDFEWDLYPIPPYEMMKPLDVLVFQYSLHVYDGKELKHYQFIGTGDSRRQLVESLLEHIPEEGTVYAYNAKGAETIRISEFSHYFPQYSRQLDSINRRMADMADPFITGLVYVTAMAGNFTLKKIEEIVDDGHSYHDLDCENGMQAVLIHRQLEKKGDGQKDKLLDELYQYCGLDTFALYRTYQWLAKIMKENGQQDRMEENI